MNNNVRIMVNSDNVNLIKYLINHNIYYDDLTVDNDKYYLTTNIDNYNKIRRRFECHIIRYYGKRFIIDLINKNKYMLISLIIGFFVLYLLTSTIFKININTDDEMIRNILINSLNDNDISIYRKKKSFDELLTIKEKILSDNEDSLEWIEIKEKGCTYNVDVTPRVKKEEIISNNEPSNIVAKKDGRILYIVSENGTKIKDINDYVKKGEVLISGNIIKGEDIIYQTHSKGKVYAEVWSSVNITMPFNYTEHVFTGKIVNHYYLDIFNHKFTIRGKYDNPNVVKSKSLILDKPYLPFKLYKEEKKIYEYKEFNITEKEAYEKALQKSEEIIKRNLKDDEYIIFKNVLKKEVFSSKIKLEVFFKTYENIGANKRIEEKEENNEL